MATNPKPFVGYYVLQLGHAVQIHGLTCVENVLGVNT